jgi:hypothetical protein
VPRLDGQFEQTDQAREKFSAVGAGAYVLVSGGLYAEAPVRAKSPTPRSTSTDRSRALTERRAFTISNYGGYDFFNHSHCYIVDSTGHPHVVILGGADVGAGALHAEVWYQH